MRFPKRYGQSMIQECPFCGKQATAQNTQEIPTCLHHKNAVLPDMKCLCGGWLDLLVSKHGPYFRCFKCGNVNWKRVIEINGPITPQIREEQKKQFNTQKQIDPLETKASSGSYGYAKIESRDKKEVVIRSDEVDLI